MIIFEHGAGESGPETTSRLDEFVQAVEATTGRRGRIARTGVRLCCPAHDDHNPSLSVHEGDDGRVLAHCFAGCSWDEICAAIDKQPDEFGPVDNEDEEEWTPVGPAVAVYDYTDATGETLFQVCRTADKQFRQRRPDATSATGWRWNLDGVPRVLYRLPEVVAAVAARETVYVCEGEKDTDAARAVGVTATCNPGGAGKWQSGYSDVLAGAQVVVIADADDAGRKHAIAVGAALAGVAGEVHLLEPAIGKDLSEHLEGGSSLDELMPLKPIDHAAAPGVKSAASAGNHLLALARAAELFQRPDGAPFASFPVGEHVETWALDSKQFQRWLTELAYVELGWTPSATRLGDIVRTLGAIAVHEGLVHDVHVRIADCDGRIVVDLADETWRAVAIGPDGWEVVGNPPVRFRRSTATRPLPLPVSGGHVDELRRFINVTDEGWILFAAWLVAALRPTGPYPVLDLVGEQGSAKSTAARVARALVDPNAAPLRSAPADGRDLMIAANNSWIVALDNLSRIRDWLSDALCRLSTGGGFATRELYTNTDETIIEAQRPVILTGIGDHATRSDLLDRELLINLPAIGEERREPEKLFWKEFEEARPRVLGALFDAVAHALANESTVELRGHPRMADFAVWACAASPSLGFDQREFLDAYDRNRSDVNAVALEDAPIAPAVLELASEGFHGTASELLQKLVVLDDAAAKRSGWPKSPTSLSGQLRRLAPNFRRAGVEIVFGKDTTGKKARFVDIRTATATGMTSDPDTADTTVTTPPPDEPETGDAGDASESAAPPPMGRERFVAVRAALTKKKTANNEDQE